MKGKTIRIYQPLEHRSIELNVNDIVGIVPSFWDGCVCLVMKDYMRYKNRKTHCQMDKRICVKKVALKKVGIHKLRDVVSHKSQVIYEKDIYNFLWDSNRGLYILRMDMDSPIEQVRISAYDFIMSGLRDYCYEHCCGGRKNA